MDSPSRPWEEAQVATAPVVGYGRKGPKSPVRHCRTQVRYSLALAWLDLAIEDGGRAVQAAAGPLRFSSRARISSRYDTSASRVPHTQRHQQPEPVAHETEAGPEQKGDDCCDARGESDSPETVPAR